MANTDKISIMARKVYGKTKKSLSRGTRAVQSIRVVKILFPRTSPVIEKPSELIPANQLEIPVPDKLFCDFECECGYCL